ncbi:hypothetical protein RRF57_003799 [Xylaria bambusicola]|uniref:Uncharacterized protein n=1 Tax=Xylaria bambusicola TaxID=326684 RepID=A0AAN7YWL3_9PEZI
MNSVEVVGIEETVRFNARRGVCMDGVSIMCGMRPEQGVIESDRCRRSCQRGGTRGTTAVGAR